MNNEERYERYEALREQGLLTHGEWTGVDERGRKTVCWLAALSPECGVSKRPSDCPAELMPAWMADLVVWIDDQSSPTARVAREIRFGALVRRFGEIDEAGWVLAAHRVAAAILRCARPPEADSWGCRDALDSVIALFDRVVAGEIVAPRAFFDLACRADVAERDARAGWTTWEFSVAWAMPAALAARVAWAMNGSWKILADILEYAPRDQLDVDLFCDAILDALSVTIGDPI